MAGAQCGSSARCELRGDASKGGPYRDWTTLRGTPVAVAVIVHTDGRVPNADSGALESKSDLGVTVPGTRE